MLRITQTGRADEFFKLPEVMEGKARRAVGKATRKMRQELLNRVREKYTLPIGYTSKSIKVKVSGLQGEIKSKGRRNPLHHFKTLPKGRITRRGVYIKAEVERGKSRTLKQSFRIKSPVIFERLGQSRYPIKSMYAISSPQMLEKVAPQVLPKAEKILSEAF